MISPCHSVYRPICQLTTFGLFRLLSLAVFSFSYSELLYSMQAIIILYHISQGRECYWNVVFRQLYWNCLWKQVVLMSASKQQNIYTLQYSLCTPERVKEMMSENPWFLSFFSFPMAYTHISLVLTCFPSIFFFWVNVLHILHTFRNSIHEKRKELRTKK